MLASVRMIAVLWLASLSWWAQAEQVVDLYRADVLVTSQRASERNKAASGGLAEIVLRVSGQVEALGHPLVIEAMARPQRYLFEFSYESTDETLNVSKGLDEQLVPASRLILKFSPLAVERLLRQAGLPVWPANRPSMLVWLVVDDFRRGRQLVASAEALDLVHVAAVRRGLPMVTPLLDLQDQIALSADDLWALNDAAVRSASERYGADSILVGRYSQTSRGQWRATWQLLHKRESLVFDSNGDDLGELYNAGIDQVADYLAGLYAIVPRDDAPEALVVEISGVRDFGEYIAALDYLESLAMVRRAALVSVRRDSLWLNLYTEGELSLLLNALDLDKKLRSGDEAGSVRLPGSRHTPRGSPENPLRFLWGS